MATTHSSYKFGQFSDMWTSANLFLFYIFNTYIELDTSQVWPLIYLYDLYDVCSGSYRRRDRGTAPTLLESCSGALKNIFLNSFFTIHTFVSFCYVTIMPSRKRLGLNSCNNLYNYNYCVILVL